MPTRWTVVLAARDKSSAQSLEALETLCQTYWYPLYAYMRRQGHSLHDAQDLTQEFFARLLEKDYLRSVAREKGRFRTFLLVALKRFLANEWDRTRAHKRGGGQVHLSLDTSSAERSFQADSAVELSPDKIYDRRWALTLLDQTLARLRGEFAQAGKSADFERLKICLTAERGSICYPDLANGMGLSEAALRVTVHRLRRRFRELFREEIAHTVADPSQIDEEVRYLLTVLGE